MLKDGIHTFTRENELGFLEGTALQIAQANVRRFGSVRLLVNLDGIDLAIEPPFEFGEARAEIVFDDDLKQMVLSSNLPAAVLAKRYGIDPRMISELRSQNDHVPVKKTGDRLKESEREIIRQSSEPASSLAIRYGVSRQAISKIRISAYKLPEPATAEQLALIAENPHLTMPETMKLTGLSLHLVRKARARLRASVPTSG